MNDFAILLCEIELQISNHKLIILNPLEFVMSVVISGRTD
jgi:hypothetical protein